MATLTQNKLTPREAEIAELIARGEPKKLIAVRLHISPRTVETTSKSIYRKTEVQNVGQLATWFFTTKFNIKLNPLDVIAVFFLALVCVNELNDDQSQMRRAKTRTVRVVKAKRSRKDEKTA